MTVTKAPQDAHRYRFNLKYFEAARDGWQEVLKAVEKARGRVRVLLPGYIGITEREGSGIFDPVKAQAADFGFYRINSQLAPDWSELEAQIESGEFDVVLVVHYFGFCSVDLARVSELCEDNGAVLVEDCAHAYQLGAPGETLGSIGHFALYSLHKYFALEAGGLLRCNDPNLHIVCDDRISAARYAPLVASSRTIEIVAKRRANYRRYAELLRTQARLQILYELNDETPQTFPVVFEPGIREPLYFRLMERDLPTVALYYRLIDEIDSAQHVAAHAMSQNILNLPVHQDIEFADIDQLVFEISDFLGEMS
jgi:dTDP-4-amino-4,6-dideoxygalactose transaminase